MQKQVTYASFVPRIFATTLDMIAISFIVTPIMYFVNKWVFLLVFKDYVVRYGVNLNESNAIAMAFTSPEIVEYISLSKFALYIIPVLCVQMGIIGSYFVFFWSKKSWTPGKYVMRMRVKDAESLETLTIKQAIKRFVFAGFAVFGIWSIVFTKKHQALHDQAASSAVITA